MLYFVDLNHTGKFTAEFTHANGQELGEKVTVSLNLVLGGGINAWQQWLIGETSILFNENFRLI